MTIGYKSFVLKPVFLVLLLATAVIMPSYSQTAVPGQTTLETDSSGSDASPVTIASLDDRLNLANTLPDYLVTPGDTYALSMAAGGGISSGLNRLELFVEEDYTVNMAFLGQVNGRGKTFSQLKQEILGIVRRAYPQSSPALVLTGLGNFEVTLKGSVTSAGIIRADGLTRLSAILSSRLLPYSSNRNITITHRNGQTNQADLFLFSRTADPAMNPYLRPGDEIVVPRADRRVTISGSVYRPGTYTLLPGETFDDLIHHYGDGLLPQADLSNVTRTRTQERVTRDYLDLSNPSAQTALAIINQDEFVIPSHEVNQDLYYVEGALDVLKIENEGQEVLRAESTEGTAKPWYRQSRRLITGLSLQDVVRSIFPYLTQDAALKDAYLLKSQAEEPLPVDIPEVLVGKFGQNITIEPGDRLVIPYAQTFTVLVRGAVETSGLVSVSGYTRLSDVISSHLLETSSTRNILLERADGTRRTLDLFQYTRYGDVTQNPYMLPGDSITIPRAERKVTISGSVYRPGTYTLLPTDTLTDLIERYAEGMLDDADPVNASVIRNNREQIKEFINLSIGQEINAIPVLNLDAFTIPSVNVRQSVFFIEGALRAERLTTTESSDARVTAAGLEPWLRERKDFIPGTNLQDAVRQAYPLLAQQAALGEAYLVKASSDEHIPVNFIEMLLGEGGRTITIEPYDRLVVPYRQFWVNVQGAVNSPGFIPFVEGRGVDYYIDVAGGVNPQAGSGSYELRTSGGDKKKPGEPVQPMDTVHVHRNNVNASIGPTLGTIGTVLGIVGSVLSLVTTIISLANP